MGAIVSMLGGAGRVETTSSPGSRATPVAHNEKHTEAATQELVWLITGSTSLLARSIIDIALARGDKVIATGRDVKKLQDLPKNDRLKLLQLDVTARPSALKLIAEEAVQIFGRVDVLVNNAGTSVKAIIEEGGSEQLRKQYDVNTFGLVDVTNAFLPYMRSRGSGTVVLMGSRSSWRTEISTISQYASSKAALRIIGETLSVEISPFGIRVLIVEPADFLTNGTITHPVFEANPISDYNEQRKAAKDRIKHIDPKNDPAKGMKILVDVVRSEGVARGRKWPLYLPLGPEAAEGIRAKIGIMQDVLDEWGDVIKDTRIEGR